MHKILYRYILKEIAGLFWLILGIFLFVLLMGKILQVVDLIVRQGVGLWDILKMFAFLILFILPFAIPMATLLSLLLCFARLSGDLEITAMKSSGIGLYQLLPPVLSVSVFASLTTLFITLQGAPWGSFAFRELAFQLAKEHISVALKEGVFTELLPNFIVYADRVHAQEGMLEGVFIHDKASAEVPLQITAQRGMLTRATPQDDVFSLRLENGTVYQCTLSEEKIRKLQFQTYEINLDLTLSQATEKLERTRRKDMDTKSLLLRISRLIERNRSADAYLAEIHRRLSIPVSCLVFGLLALPLALQAGPQGRSHGLLMGSLIFMVYYLLFSTGKTLAERGITPWIGLWGPNILLGALAVYLLIRTAKEKPSTALVRLNTILDHFQKWLDRRLGKRT